MSFLTRSTQPPGGGAAADPDSVTSSTGQDEHPPGGEAGAAGGAPNVEASSEASAEVSAEAGAQAGAGAEAEQAGGPGSADDTAVDGAEVVRRPRKVIVSRVVTTLACLLVLFALIGPDRASRFTPAAFVRVPLEALLCVVLVLVLPARARRLVAVPLGMAFGLLAIVKMADIGFYSVLDRPFRPTWDGPALSSGVEFLSTSIGRTGAIATAVAVGLLAVAVLVLMTLSLTRLTRVVAGHGSAATRTVKALGVVWIVCAVTSVQIIPGVPVATVAFGRSGLVIQEVRDKSTFAREITVDRFRDTPGKDLLTGLRGKDVLLAFVESYGRFAIEDPTMTPQVGAVLDASDRRLRAAGFHARSAFLGSPTSGGGSWLAHSTLLSGVWVNNQQRYTTLVKTRRLTLNNAFRRAGWRTVGVVPGTVRAWPEAGFFGYDQVYDRWHLGYRGPGFNWNTPPDQYTLSAFERFERAKPDHAPVMAELPMVSSHSPWGPTPKMIDWKQVGDGSVYEPMWKTTPQPDTFWGNPTKMREAYRGSIAYTLSALLSYVETYGDDDLVVVFLGDHQAAPVITGSGVGRDVPITVLTRDPAVLDRISGWGWQDGLKPNPKAPVWPMHTFRDRFLTAFGPGGGTAAQ